MASEKERNWKRRRLIKNDARGIKIERKKEKNVRQDGEGLKCKNVC